MSYLSSASPAGLRIRAVLPTVSPVAVLAMASKMQHFLMAGEFYRQVKRRWADAHIILHFAVQDVGLQRPAGASRTHSI